jgi:hypothetical protein
MSGEHSSFLSIFGLTDIDFENYGENVVLEKKKDYEGRLFRQGQTLVYRSNDPRVWGRDEVSRRDH